MIIMGKIGYYMVPKRSFISSHTRLNAEMFRQSSNFTFYLTH
jgi:hypothetical protein